MRITEFWFHRYLKSVKTENGVHTGCDCRTRKCRRRILPVASARRRMEWRLPSVCKSCSVSGRRRRELLRDNLRRRFRTVRKQETLAFAFANSDWLWNFPETASPHFGWENSFAAASTSCCDKKKDNLTSLLNHKCFYIIPGKQRIQLTQELATKPLSDNYSGLTHLSRQENDQILLKTTLVLSQGFR